jgi:hypothetical protein
MNIPLPSLCRCAIPLSILAVAALRGRDGRTARRLGHRGWHYVGPLRAFA